jgi:transcriptional regulator with XRE-family HTH domain
MFETPTLAAADSRVKKLGVNKNTLISHENGNREISRQAAERYAKAFNVKAGWLLYGDDSEDGSAPPELSQLEAVSALAAALTDAEARSLHARLSARIQSATPKKSSNVRPASSAAKAKSGQRTHSS